MPGWGFDSSALRHYIKVLDFPGLFT